MRACSHSLSDKPDIGRRRCFALHHNTMHLPFPGAWFLPQSRAAIRVSSAPSLLASRALGTC
jgi:hypothetical protein